MLQTSAAQHGNVMQRAEGEGPELSSGDSETFRQLRAAKKDLCSLEEETFTLKT